MSFIAKKETEGIVDELEDRTVGKNIHIIAQKKQKQAHGACRIPWNGLTHVQRSKKMREIVGQSNIWRTAQDFSKTDQKNTSPWILEALQTPQGSHTKSTILLCTS